MKYGRQASLTYTSPPRTFRRLRQAAIPVQAKTAAKTVQKASTVANVMDVANFLSRYLSGKQNVLLVPVRHPAAGFAVGPRMSPSGKPYYQMLIPHWETYQLAVKGFDKYRIFRTGIWHESCHVKYTPEALYLKGTQRDVVNDLINIIEDRRIEDLGVKEWQGYIPERLYTQAYAYALRPKVDEIKNRDHRVFEAFLQRLLIGKIKGNLPPDEAKIVEEAAQMVERKLSKLDERASDHTISKEVLNLALDVRKLLGLGQPAPISSAGAGSAWEDTFTAEYARHSGKSRDEIEKEMDEWFKEKEKEAKKESREKGKVEAGEVTRSDVEQARKGTTEARNEYEQIQRQQPLDPALIHWSPAASQMSPNEFRDAKFIQAMNTYLQSWRTGFIRKVGETGASFSVKEYIRNKDEPFVTRLKRSAKGKKILILTDFSISMEDKEEDYKKALISALEVLDSIGSNVAVFAFAVDPAQGQGFYKIKTFEEPKLKNTHLAKLAALRAAYPGTPTDHAYKALVNYVARSKPEVFVTVTDGEPGDKDATKEMVNMLKRHTRMVAFGIPAVPNEQARRQMENSLKSFNYNKVFAVTHLHQIPPKLVNLLIT